MSLQAVRESLFYSRLNLPDHIEDEIFDFIELHQIKMDPAKALLLTVAAASIISEEKIANSQSPLTTNGLPLTFERAMNHLSSHSKENFIELLHFIVFKNQTLQALLSHKLTNLDISYRLFKKYRIIFEDLWPKAAAKDFVKNDLLSIFWVLYLLFKHKKHGQYIQQDQQVKLLVVIIRSIFCNWLASIAQQIVDQKIESLFNKKVEDLIDEQFFVLNHVELFNQTQKIYTKRYKDQTMDFKIFSKNPIKIAKFLNDIATYFANFSEDLKIKGIVLTTDIEEICFLNLQMKILSLNYGIRPKIDEKSEQKNAPEKKLAEISEESSQKSDDRKQNRVGPRIPVPKQFSHVIIAENLPRIMTPLKDRSDNAATVTPCHSRMVNLEWIRNCLYFMSRPETNPIFNKAFNFVQKQSLIDFEFKARKQLFSLVQEFNPKCLRKENRVNDMLSFFKYIIIKISQDHDQEENAKMFKEVKTFNAILCLSCDIFNYVYNSAMSSYRRVCEIFEVPLIEALKPINWIGKNISKPSQIYNYLYTLEKRIVIKEIWEDETGYNLLKSRQIYNESSSIEYPDFVVWGRLIKHIFDRVEELCKEVKIEHRLTKRVKGLIDTILKQKPFLLHKNKIDQIIICCITSFLTINQIIEKNTLEKVFNGYNRMDLSETQNQKGLTGDGREMTLSEFYNEVFLTQIQEIVQKNSTETDFLLTPIRQSYHQKATAHLGLMTPFTKKYPENQIDMGENFRPMELSGSGLRFEGLSFVRSANPLMSPQNYRAKQFLNELRLIAEKPKMDEEDEEDDEDDDLGSKSKNSEDDLSERSDEDEDEFEDEGSEEKGEDSGQQKKDEKKEYSEEQKQEEQEEKSVEEQNLEKVKKKVKLDEVERKSELQA